MEQTCERCGNEYKNPIYVKQGGVDHVFDCFECAIEVVAPRCVACGIHIIGHGVEEAGLIFCCASYQRGYKQKKR